MRIALAPLMKRYSVLLILLCLCLFLTIASPRFVRPGNLINVALQSSITAIVALGILLPILSGGIDLSVGSTVALVGAISAGLITNSGWGTGPAILAALLTGSTVGFFIGILVVFGKIPPFMASLSLMAIARGLTLVYTKGKPIANLPEDYLLLSGKLGLFPLPVIFLIILTMIIHGILTKSRFGHHIYAVGGNVETARLAGIYVKRITISVYVICGTITAFAALLLTARLWSAQPNAGTGLELEAITAVVLGGTSLMGGSGTAGGTVVGALIMGVIGNGLNLLKIPSYIQQVIKGLILIVTIMVDIQRRKGRINNSKD